MKFSLRRRMNVSSMRFTVVFLYFFSTCLIYDTAADNIFLYM